MKIEEHNTQRHRSVEFDDGAPGHVDGPYMSRVVVVGPSDRDVLTVTNIDAFGHEATLRITRDTAAALVLLLTTALAEKTS